MSAVISTESNHMFKKVISLFWLIYLHKSIAKTLEKNVGELTGK